ncbi:glycosyltransferase family 39 protein [Nostoc sp. UHCC 0302]|uniref:glycosyltransferase family 39 protein n=1 Tax=Nostoc sp. UHCC 0302 TaxID=3134896 RepID=UPI00311CC304
MPKYLLPSSAWLRFLVVTVLALGLFFRFANLERKFYWYDETFTSLRISGYTEDEVAKQVFTGQEISVSSLQKFQNPNPEKGLIDAIKGMAKEDPHIPPLYFILLRLWTDLFGGSIISTRSFSAVISLLALPCIYWLCQELFKSPLVGWIATLLIAVSPFHLLYAQEARMYSLWTVTTLLSSAALLQAIRLKKRIGWVIYTITLTLGLYTYLFTLLTALGHGIYVFVIERFRLTKTLLSYLIASIAGLILFLPWISNIFLGTSEIDKRLAWANTKPDLLSLIKAWPFQPSRLFFDVGVGGQSSGLSILLASPIAIILLALVVYSIYYLCTKAPRNTWVFVLTLIIVLPLFLIFRDVFKGGKISTIMRYLIPGYLGMQIAVAYFLSSKITDVSISNIRRQFWQSVTTVLLLSGIISCVLVTQAVSWWHTGEGNYKFFQVAQIINQSEQPLVISSGSIHTEKSVVGSVLSLSHLLDSTVKLQLTVEPEVPNVSSDSNNIFLYQPPASLVRNLEQKYEIKPATNEKLGTKKDKIFLWRLSLPNKK